MAEVERISAAQARQLVQRGQALLVCAYDDDARCGQLRLEGAITLSELRRELPSPPEDKEIILYCA